MTDTEVLFPEVAAKRTKAPNKNPSDKPKKVSRKRSSDSPRRKPREDLRKERSRNASGGYSREQIQEFNFRLRDDLKRKVQAEVPHEWLGELEDVARELNVKKLELYRFIFGLFLGKIGEETENE